MNRRNQSDLELYEALTALQSFYRELYKDLEAQFRKCACFSCKIRLITFGMELVSVNSQVEGLEAKLAPPVNNILNALSIPYVTSDDGQTRLTQ